MRYPVADRLSILRQRLPVAGLNMAYSVKLTADAAQDDIHWDVVKGKLPEGLSLDRKKGVIHGMATEITDQTNVTVRATDTAGNSDEHIFTIRVRPGEISTGFLPLAFVGIDYRHQLKAQFMAEPLKWTIIKGSMPEGVVLDSDSGQLRGRTKQPSFTNFRIEVKASNKQTDQKNLILKVVPASLRHIKADANTVVLYNWQGPSGKLIKDVMGDDNLTLTWVNMKGDTRVQRPGWGGYPLFIGGGEGGFVGPQHNDKLDLRTCSKEWTVEAWVKRGGRSNIYFEKLMKRHFDFGHICGTYDASERGVWEFYLSDHDSPDGSMAPGVHFLGAEPGQALMDLHPWKRAGGIMCDRQDVGISDSDTEWHHVAWQYSYKEDLHQLFLDGKLIWQMKNPDGIKLVNNRKHDAQFSIGARLKGYARYGGKFNWLGWGHFFGQIGEIRISNIRRYGNCPD